MIPLHDAATAVALDAAPVRRGDLLRRQLRWITIAWTFGTVWLWAISGAAMTQFARELGMPDYGFGILAALPFVGTLIQVPVSYFLERYGHRRKLFLWAATLHRVLWVIAAAIPWLIPGFPSAWWPMLVVLLLLSWLLGQASGPAWMNWMSDLIPRRVRGRYFALRNVVTQPIGVAVTLGIGFLLTVVEGRGEADGDLMLKVTAAVLGVGGLFGALDILSFLKVDDPAPPQPRREVNLLSLMRQPLRDVNFRRYLAFNFTFVLATGFIGQYVWLYAFDVVEWSYWRANLLLIAVPLFVRIFVVRPWGRLTDRMGKKPVLLITGCFTIFGAVGWLMITPERFWLGYSLILLTSLMWPGMEIANFNFTLDMAGSRRGRSELHGRERESAGTAYVALNSMAIAVGGVLSGLLGSAIAGALQGWERPLGLGDVVMTYHGVLFGLSTLLRAMAMVFAFGLAEPRATGTRDAVRYMTGSLYSNVRQAFTMPGRMVGHVFRWSYRIRR